MDNLIRMPKGLNPDSIKQIITPNKLLLLIKEGSSLAENVKFVAPKLGDKHFGYFIHVRNKEEDYEY